MATFYSFCVAVLGSFLSVAASFAKAQTIDYTQLSQVQFKNGNYGCIDATGKVVLRDRTEFGCRFSQDGVEVFKVGVGYGYRRFDGEVLVPPKYSYATPIEGAEQVGAVTENGLTSIVDKTGKIIASPGVEWIWGFDNSIGITTFKKNGKYGYLNTKGEIVLSAQYSTAWDMADNGIAVVEINGKRRFIDRTGKVVIGYQFDLGNQSFVAGLAPVARGAIGNSKYGYINEQGELIIPLKFNYASKFHSSGYARVAFEGACRVIDEKGNFVNLPIAKLADDNNMPICSDIDKNGLVLIKEHENNPPVKWYYVNVQGQRVSNYIRD